MLVVLCPTEKLAAIVYADRRTPCRVRGIAAAYPPDDQLNAVYARRLCAGCPVRAECLELALRQEAADADSYGVRGGTTPKTRRRIIRSRSDLQVIPQCELWNLRQVLAYTSWRGRPMERPCWADLVKRHQAPQPARRGKWRSGYWWPGEIRAWCRVNTPNC